MPVNALMLRTGPRAKVNREKVRGRRTLYRPYGRIPRTAAPRQDSVHSQLIHRRVTPQRQLIRRGYPIADAIWKIGKYMAITMKPMIVPRKTIITGSRREVSAATA